DLQSIPGQKMQASIKAALREQGFIEVFDLQKADLQITVLYSFGVSKTTTTTLVPNTIYVPGTTARANTVTNSRTRLSSSQTTIFTPGKTIHAGMREHTSTQYGVQGSFTLTASAWKEWVEKGSISGLGPRVVWESK